MLSGTQEIGFLGIGVPDTIISRIAGLKDLRVRALLSPGKERANPQEIGRELGVDHVLIGTIQKAGDQMRITPQLIRVDDGVAIWTRPYTLPSTTDLFRVQDEIARGVIEALQVPWASEERVRAERQRTQDPEAYALYVRGRAELTPNARASTMAAVNSFQAALARDSQFVLAHAGIAMASAKMRLFFAAEDEGPTWYDRAHKAAQEALRLDPELAETREALAAVHRSTDFNWLQTIEEATRALEHKPGLDQPHLYLASAFMHLGLFERAAAEATMAIDRNPANTDEPLRVQGAIAMYDGRFDESVSILKQAAAARGAAAEWNLAYAYLQRRRYGHRRNHVAEDHQRERPIETAGTGDTRGRACGAARKGGSQDVDPGGSRWLVHGPSRCLRFGSSLRPARHAEGSARSVARGPRHGVRMSSVVRAGPTVGPAQEHRCFPALHGRIQAVVDHPAGAVPGWKVDGDGLRRCPSCWRRPPQNQPPAADPDTGTARTMNRCGAAPTW